MKRKGKRPSKKPVNPAEEHIFDTWQRGYQWQKGINREVRFQLWRLTRNDERVHSDAIERLKTLVKSQEIAFNILKASFFIRGMGKQPSRALANAMVEKLTAKTITRYLSRTKTSDYHGLREGLAERLIELAFRSVPERNKTRLEVAERFFEPLAQDKAALLLMAIASQPKMIKNIPTDLKDTKQRRQFEYLKSLRDATKERSVEELAEALGLIKPKK